MCCGNDYDGLEAALAAPATEGVMSRIFTTVPGAVLQIGGYGQASNDSPAIVPPLVGEEFSEQEGFRVEFEHGEKTAVKKEKAAAEKAAEAEERKAAAAEKKPAKGKES